MCGLFFDFEFVIYTTGNVASKSPLQGGNSDPLNILCSGTDYGKYITFNETCDRDIFGFLKSFQNITN
jgi:hypothetical protein